MSKQKEKFDGQKPVDLGKVSSEIPFPTNKFLFIDIDGTLIDHSYQLTSDGIVPAIENLQAQGWEIGLSSDTPLGPMQAWRERLHMNDPLVAERGSIIEVEGTVYDQKNDFQIFQEALKKMKSAFLAQGYKLWEGNTLEFFRKGERFGEHGDIAVLINMHRTHSIGFYVRKVNNEGVLEKDQLLTNQVVDNVRNLFPNIEDLSEDLNHEYGLLILSRKSVVKRLGTLEVARIKALTQIGMIGNSITDYVGSDLAVHYAVSNSTPEFIEKADFISDAPLTQGVIEILNKLAARKV